MLETPEPPELFQGDGDGRLAPYEGDEMMDEEKSEEQKETTTNKHGGITQEQWDKFTVKERKYFLLMVTFEAACVFGDKEQMAAIERQMKILGDEIYNDALADRSVASSSHHEVQEVPHETSQIVEECEDKPGS